MKSHDIFATKGCRSHEHVEKSGGKAKDILQKVRKKHWRFCKRALKAIDIFFAKSALQAMDIFAKSALEAMDILQKMR